MVTTDFSGKRSSDAASGVATQSDGKIVAVGGSDASGTADFAIARYDSKGALDARFGKHGKVTTNFPGRFSHAAGVAQQSDGKIVVAGGDGGDFALARYNPDGTLDSGFGSGGRVTTDFSGAPRRVDEAAGVAIQNDGKIVAAGTAGRCGFEEACATDSDFALARYNPDGTLDSGFGSGGKVTFNFDRGSFDEATAVALQAGGKIVVAGNAAGGGFALVRYNPDGSLDRRFGKHGKVTTDLGFDDFASALAIQNDGRIVAVGSVFGDEGSDFAVARYTRDGRPDPTFGTGGSVVTDFFGEDHARGVTIQSDGRIIAAGDKNSVVFALARYNPDGTLDSDFGFEGRVLTSISEDEDFASAVAVQSDGKIVAAGTSGVCSGFIGLECSGDPSGVDFGIARYNPDGSLDQTFGGGQVRTDFSNGSDDRASAIAIGSDGKILAVGTSKTGEESDFAVARYMAP